MTPPTEEQVKSIVNLTRMGVCSGLGVPEPGKMCIEALVCYALGEAHGESPSCVAITVRALKITLNDRHWSSSAVRGAGLQKVAIAQLGSVDAFDEKAFQDYACLYFFKHVIPVLVLRATKDVTSAQFSVVGLVAQTADNLNTARVVLGKITHWIKSVEEQEDTADLRRISELRQAIVQCGIEARRLTNYPTSAATLRLILHNLIHYCDERVEPSVSINLNRAISNVDSIIDGTMESDGILNAYAESILKALIKVKSPGCKWLHLADSNTVS